jgi:hypothetical protein
MGCPMNAHVNVYRLRVSIEYKRPRIDFDDFENADIDWLLIGDVLDGVKETNAYSPVSIKVNHPKATSWDYYMAAGTLGVFSGRFVTLIGETCFELFDLMPLHLNGEAYFFLRCRDVVPCLDISRAEVTYFKSDPKAIMEVKKYAFDKTRLTDPWLFSLPEPHGQLFATETVRQRALKHSLKGFELQLVG